MKIGIDARLWHENGVGRYVRKTVLGLDNTESKHEFVIFLPKKGFESIIFKNPNFRKVMADVSWHSVREQHALKRILDRENVDLMHFTYFSYPLFYKKPFVITIHDLIVDHFPTGRASSLPLPIYHLKRQAYKHLTRSAVKNSVKIIVPTNDVKEEVMDHYKANPKKIEVIYEGFDTVIKKGEHREQKVSKNYLLYVGNAYPHKNLENLLIAFKKLRETQNIDLVLIGRQDFFYDRLESKLTQGVYFLHNVDDSELFDYYKGAVCTVVPSVMEGFGLPLLEAMSLSCPVASSSTNALKEIGGDACIYFDPKNPKDIARVLNEVISNPSLRSELVAKGLIQSKKFSWDESVRQTLKVYESCNSV